MSSNLNDYQTWYEKEKKHKRKVILATLKAIGKSDLIPYLIELKIISQDWQEKRNKYILREKTFEKKYNSLLNKIHNFKGLGGSN